MKTTDPRLKNFKKKSTATNVEESPQTDKLSSLKQKLEKQRLMMNKAGRRFRQENSISTQEISIQTEPIENVPQQTKSIQVSTFEQPKKQSISLADIDFGTHSQTDSLSSSRVFQKQIEIQKKKQKQLAMFLREIQLEEFTEALINSGFDDVDTLMEISTEDLNHLMMRALQQTKLMSAIKERKPREETVRPLTTNPSIIRAKTQYRPVTSESFVSVAKTQQFNSSRVYQNIPKTGSLLNNSSFLLNVGGKSWSVEDQVRRACSGCFKMTQQMEKKGDCYYCQECFKLVAGDLLTITLKTTTPRAYRQV